MLLFKHTQRLIAFIAVVALATVSFGAVSPKTVEATPTSTIILDTTLGNPAGVFSLHQGSSAGQTYNFLTGRTIGSFSVYLVTTYAEPFNTPVTADVVIQVWDGLPEDGLLLHTQSFPQHTFTPKTISSWDPLDPVGWETFELTPVNVPAGEVTVTISIENDLGTYIDPWAEEDCEMMWLPQHPGMYDECIEMHSFPVAPGILAGDHGPFHEDGGLMYNQTSSGNIWGTSQRGDLWTLCHSSSWV